MSRVYKYNYNTIENTLSKKIGKKECETGRGILLGVTYDDEFNSWFYNDAERDKYSDYICYLNSTYFYYQVWTNKLFGINNPRDIYFYLFTDLNLKDTFAGNLNKSILKETVLRSESYGRSYIKRNITRNLSNLLSINGYLDGFRVTIDEYTGRAAKIMLLDGGHRNNLDGIEGYFKGNYNNTFNTNPHLLSEEVLFYLWNNLKLNKYIADGNDSSVYDYRDIKSGQVNFPDNNENITTVYYESYPNQSPNDTDGVLFNNQMTIYHANFKPSDLNRNSLLSKTNDSFRKGKYNTLISRFYGKDDNYELNNATSCVGGDNLISHGRNLLKKNNATENINGYDNPYCRVWTHHYQYDKFNKLIRPFNGVENNEKLNVTLKNDYNWEKFRANKNGREGWKKLDDNTSMDYKTNLVNITPFIKDGELDKNSIKRCMFSIENLAWRDIDDRSGEIKTLSEDQKGPYGGRIMWFPPYGLTFNENVTVNWNGNDFIGRGEKIYTYLNTERTGNLSFKMLIDHPSIIDYWKETEDDYEDEQDLLRFFAGCDILSINKVEKEEYKYLIKSKPVVKNEPKKEVLKFSVFFPNNYSQDYDRQGYDITVMYLLNGVGTGFDENGLDVYQYNEFKNTYNLYYSNPSASDFPYGYTPESAVIRENGESGSGYTWYGGYEMDEKCGLSCFKYAALSRTNRKIGSSITGLTGSNISSGSDLFLYSVISGGTGIVNSGLLSKLNDKKNYIYHRIDSIYLKSGEGEYMTSLSNCYDSISYGLNSKFGYDSGVLGKIYNELNPNQETPSENKNYIFSFSDIAKFAETERLKGMNDTLYDTNRVEFLKEMFTTHKISKVNVLGVANSQGTKGKKETRNERLSRQRGTTISDWIGNKFKPYFLSGATIGTYKRVEKVNDATEKSNDNNTLDAKLKRRVDVEIELTEIEQVTNVNKEEVEEIKFDTLLTANSKEELNKIKEKYERMGYEVVTSTETTEVTDEHNEIGGYGNEYKFFNKLNSTDTIFRENIKHKIKYFDPAYHSISPEGFNSRLTFLHQCTRQGPTTIHKENAKNLSFGRAPICVLRIGDFYNTKILINSLQITYEESGGIQWDLNPEGIGVSPMIANINMSFTFLGGSDLSGPISRLQNAVSFNYYANTGVYDSKAEEMIYENGVVIGIKDNQIKSK